MNHKNCRVKGCWSRGAPQFSTSAPRTTTVATARGTSPLYRRPVFRNSLKNNLTSTQKDVTTFFENYPYINKTESFSFNNNTQYAVIYLKQSDFENGTVRIKKPGVYLITENIVFNPNEYNDFFPTTQQTNTIYPQNMEGPYHLGFFAAITVEADDVIIDLRGHTIEQSKNHNFQQRFYANIELANMPFVPTQGPGNFAGAMSYKAANRVLVYNGFLKRSSHHGIHANIANKVILSNLVITQFEVAAIALNGTTTGILSDIFAGDIKKDIDVLSTYSAARFIRKFIDAHINSNITLNGKTVSQIKTALINDMDATFTAFKNGTALPNNYFKNPNVGYDGNVYGIVLNVKGVVVNKFIEERTTEMIGNIDIHLDKLTIDDIESHPIEIVGVNVNSSSDSAYGGKVQVGTAGGVLQIGKLQDDNGKYKANSLSDAKLILAKINATPKGTINISSDIIDWAESSNSISPGTIPGSNSRYYVSTGDSMGHFMKGNIGLFRFCWD